MKKLIYHNSWDNLSMAEKAEMIGVAVRNGITSLPEIRAKYNEFAEGGDTVGEWVDAIYQNNPKEEFLGEPEHHYDFTQSEEWANAHGYYPDARGHRDDRVKKPAHPSHPSRGTWNGDKFILTDTGMENPNYTLFGLNDGGQDPQAILTYQGGSVIPEITVTPNGNYIYNPYDNIKLHYSEGGNLYGGGSYLDKAKAMIRANEGWRSKPYKDAPKGKNWRSVGYGFNDSGFWERYPEGISKHYENGITKAQAEKELDYFLGKAERQLKGIYGKRWNSFNDDQKAAILDTYYQRPASVGSKSGFYGAVMSGKDGAPYLGVQGFGDRNQSRRDLYRGRGVTAPVSFESIAEPVGNEADEVLHFEPLNPQAFGMQLPTYQAPVIDTIDTIDRIDTIDKTYDPAAIEKQERQDNLRRFGMFMSMLDGTSGQDSGMPDFIDMLAGKPITFSRGGRLYDGTSEGSQQMRNGKYFATNSQGDSYYLSPSALTSNEVNVTVPETFITANPDDVARGNAQRWWREYSNVYGEKGLEQVSPEFDLITLSPLLKPIVNTGLRSAGRIIGKTNRLANSPLTGNWTKIGNREYRLSPNSLGANGAPIESRAVAPQITAENAAIITPEQWTAAQDAAIARGDMAEAQRLRDLHFKVSAPTPYISKGVYLPYGNQSILSQADYYNGNNDLVTLYHSSVDADNLIKEGFDGVEHGLGRTKGEAKGTIFASANPDYAADYSNLYIQEGLSTPDKVGLVELKVPRGAGAFEGNEVRLRPEHIKEITKSAYEKTPWLRWLKTRKTNNNLFNIKSADAVTFDDNGVRIPLGSRDNFNLNDIRYGLLPIGIGLTGYGLNQKR